MQQQNRLHSAMDGEAARNFLLNSRYDLIKMLPRESTLMAADILLGKKCFSEEVYTNIRDEHSETERVRKLFDALKPGSLRSYSIFYTYLKKDQKPIFEELEKHSWSDTESEPLPKRPKINEERVKEPDKPQVQESRVESDSGSNRNFAGFTFSQLLQHVEEPEEMESLVASLEQRLREGQMEEIKSLLVNRVLKNTVIFNHAEFKKMTVNHALTEFLKTKNQAIFPVKLLENFFSGSAKKKAEALDILTEPEKSDGNTGMLLDEPFLSQDENFNVTHPGAQSTPCRPRQKFHSGTGATMPESVIESLDGGYETSARKSSASFGYWSDHGVDVAIGTAGSDIDSGAFSAGTLTDTSSIVTFSNEFPAVELAESASAKTSAEEFSPGKPADASSFVKPPDVASQFKSADEFPAVKPTDVSSAFTSTNKFSAGTPAGTSPVVTPAFANLAVRPNSAVAILSERPVEATSVVLSGEEHLAVTQADASSAIKSADIGSAYRSLDEFSADGPRGSSLEVKPAIVNSSLRPAGEFAVDVNDGRSNHCNPKKRGNRCKIEKTKWQEKQCDILGNYLRKNISTQEIGKQGKMEDCFRIINNREHPRYPVLQADHCNVIFDHKTNAKKIIEVLDASAFTKKGEPKEEYKFRAQFHMWLLGISETVILSENKEDSLEKRPFEVEEKRFQQFINEVVIPALALYKKLQYSMIVT
ncbi:hypothetical protein GJAV_G00121750 [Gymnothorax javanicus]|nr:hypothetical protein GJAV_G00121750 [Gymnothorax javanicus]